MDAWVGVDRWMNELVHGWIDDGWVGGRLNGQTSGYICG